MSSWGMPDMQRYAPPPHQQQQQQQAQSSRNRGGHVFQQGPGPGHAHPDVSAGGYRMDQMSSHDGSYLGGASNGNPFGDHQVGRNTMNVMTMDNPNQTPTTAHSIAPSHSQAPGSGPSQQQQQQQQGPSQPGPPMQGHESPSQSAAHLRPSLQSQLDALLKTQTDVITYLQVELERRRDWEDRMNKELQQRHAVLLTLLTQLMPVSAGGPNAAVPAPGGAFAGPPGGPPVRPAEILSRNLGNGGNGAPGSVSMANDLSHGPAPGGSKQKTPAMPHPDALMAHLTPNMGGGPRLSASSLPHLLDAGRYHADPTFFGLHDRGLANGHDMVNGGYAPDGDDGFGASLAGGQGGAGAGNSGRMSAKPTSKASKRKRREGTGSSDEGRGGVEVDERGVIYMANGKKTDSRPAKIQSLVRKSIQAGMGMTNGKRHIPSLDEDPLQPGEEWRFGNLRFDWDKTPRQSSHNAHLKEIVLNHIMKSRAEYPSIPDADFTPTRLDHSFDQAFTTWRGKFKEKNRRDVGGNVSVDVEG